MPQSSRMIVTRAACCSQRAISAFVGVCATHDAHSNATIATTLNKAKPRPTAPFTAMFRISLLARTESQSARPCLVSEVRGPALESPSLYKGVLAYHRWSPEEAVIRIASWNVNSIRARIAHLTEWLKSNSPDIMLL